MNGAQQYIIVSVKTIFQLMLLSGCICTMAACSGETAFSFNSVVSSDTDTPLNSNLDTDWNSNPGSDTDSKADSDAENGDCQEGDTKDGDTVCGPNERGAIEQECVDGQWQDTTTCNDSDECIDESVQIGSTTCGTDNQGRKEEKCVNGQWKDTGECTVKAQCIDGETQDVGSCGTDDKGKFHQECVDGFWEQPGTCIGANECVEGSTRKTDDVCGAGDPPRGYYIEECKNDAWTQKECYDLDLDIGGPCECVGNDCEQNIPVVGQTMKHFFEAPGQNRTIVGCDYVKEKYGDWPYTTVGCMRSQEGGYNPQYWPNGYCMILSFGCTGNSLMCSFIPTAGNFQRHTTCPPGFVLFEEQYVISVLLMNFTLKNKYCLQSCEQDSDCRTTEDDPVWGTTNQLYECHGEEVEGETIKYCWDPNNELSPSHGVTQF